MFLPRSSVSRSPSVFTCLRRPTSSLSQVEGGVRESSCLSIEFPPCFGPPWVFPPVRRSIVFFYFCHLSLLQLFFPPVNEILHPKILRPTFVKLFFLTLYSSVPGSSPTTTSVNSNLQVGSNCPYTHPYPSQFRVLFYDGFQ